MSNNLSTIYDAIRNSPYLQNVIYLPNDDSDKWYRDRMELGNGTIAGMFTDTSYRVGFYMLPERKSDGYYNMNIRIEFDIPVSEHVATYMDNYTFVVEWTQYSIYRVTSSLITFGINWSCGITCNPFDVDKIAEDLERLLRYYASKPHDSVEYIKSKLSDIEKQLTPPASPAG